MEPEQYNFLLQEITDRINMVNEPQYSDEAKIKGLENFQKSLRKLNDTHEHYVAKLGPITPIVRENIDILLMKYVQPVIISLQKKIIKDLKNKLAKQENSALISTSQSTVQNKSPQTNSTNNNNNAPSKLQFDDRLFRIKFSEFWKGRLKSLNYDKNGNGCIGFFSSEEMDNFRVKIENNGFCGIWECDRNLNLFTIKCEYIPGFIAFIEKYCSVYQSTNSPGFSY